MKTEHNVKIKAECWNPNCGMRGVSWVPHPNAEEQGLTSCIICNDTGRVEFKAVMEIDMEECP